MLEAHSKSQYHIYKKARVELQTHTSFLLVGQVPLCVCVCRRNCVVGMHPVTRSPSCARLHTQTVQPLPPPTCVVSFSTHPFGWTEHGAVTFSSGGQYGSHFSVHKPARGLAKQKSQNFENKSIVLLSHNTVGCKMRSSRTSAGKFFGKSARTR